VQEISPFGRNDSSVETTAVEMTAVEMTADEVTK
jgi:hypothetical protein